MVIVQAFELTLPIDIYSAQGVREIDAMAINEAGIPGYTLMTRAAEAALEVAIARFPEAVRWQVVCGAGNNAGDGYVLARLAAARGIPVSVLTLTPPEKLTGDAATAYEDFVAAGGAVGAWQNELDSAADLIVDGIIGSGLQRDIEGRFAEAVRAMNDHPSRVLALDVPTGISADNGKVLGVAVRADVTVTFVGLKSGLFLADGPEFSGTLEYAGLGIPADCREKASVFMRRIGAAEVAASLPPRRRSAHKGDFGHLLIVGGGPGMPGAVILAGAAALRSGAGLVTVATHPAHHAQIVVARPELMCRGIEGAADLEPLLAKADVVAVGPGLGTGDWSREIFDRLTGATLPMVVDADGLNLLAESPSTATERIITPHPGEAARLLDITTPEVQSDRLIALEAMRSQFGGTVVLKGAGTLVSSASGPPRICTAGNPGMAAPGMGDVLTGIIGGLLAQGLSIDQGAAIGVAAHAQAGDRAATDGQRGMMASDLLRELRACVNPAPVT